MHIFDKIQRQRLRIADTLQGSVHETRIPEIVQPGGTTFGWHYGKHYSPFSFIILYSMYRYQSTTF